ncbi:MAG: tetratricopeptide repeat protein [Bacteroidales bacterium]|nr:tetratricopeptide repeat protein [Bacteroidales bacterium]
MNVDRFKNFPADVRTLVQTFEAQDRLGQHFFDVDEFSIIADFYLEVGDVDGLKKAVAQAEKIYPSSNEVRLQRSHLLSLQGEYAKALEILKELEAAEPKNTDVSYSLGMLYSMTDHPKQAIDYYLRAATDGYELDMVYGNIADEYYKLHNIEESIRYYKRSIEKNPEEDRSLYNLACTYDEQGRNEEAEAFFVQHVTDHPYSKGGWYCLGCVYSWLSLYEKAADAYEYAIAIDKTLFHAYLGLSDCYHRMGDVGRAVRALHDSLDFTDDRAYVYYNMGHLYLEKGNCATASIYLHDSVKADPSFALAWNDLGRCCAISENYDEAAGYFRRAIDLDPDTDEHWLCLADLYLWMGRYDEACALMESSRFDAVSRFEFDCRLLYSYYKMGRRNRFFTLLQEDAEAFGPLYRSLLSQYPEFQNDVEVVNAIDQLGH